MTTRTSKTRSIICNKNKTTAECSGCLQDFCPDHLTAHRQELQKQLNNIERNHDVFRHSFTQQIDQWEQDSIEKIKQTAEEAGQSVLTYITESKNQIEEKLYRFREQRKRDREENDITEIVLEKWENELQQLTKNILKPLNIIMEQNSTPLINKIHIKVSSKYIHIISMTSFLI